MIFYYCIQRQIFLLRVLLSVTIFSFEQVPNKTDVSTAPHTFLIILKMTLDFGIGSPLVITFITISSKLDICSIGKTLIEFI